MSTPADAPSGAVVDDSGQVVIDGFPLAERLMGLQGRVSIQPKLYDELTLGTRLRLTVDVDVVSRTDRKKRSQWGDDEAHRVLGISIHATRKATIVHAEPEAETPTEAAPEPVRRGKAAERRARSQALAAVPDAAEASE